MATYKFDVIQKLGKYHSIMYEAGGAKANPLDTPARDSIADVLDALQAEIGKRGKSSSGSIM